VADRSPHEICPEDRRRFLNVDGLRKNRISAIPMLHYSE
jgi:hypothetical protein